MTVRFLEIAEIELDDAINWYRAQAPGLGDAFLYGLIYTTDNDDILVIAVAHLHRRPEYWRDRLQR